jgi:hypothetical protein
VPIAVGEALTAYLHHSTAARDSGPKLIRRKALSPLGSILMLFLIIEGLAPGGMRTPAAGALRSLEGSARAEVEAMIIDFLRQEHRNSEGLLVILERELSLFARGKRPDYEVIRAIIAYFEVYPDAYHHPQEDLVFKKFEMRDPKAAGRCW